MYLCIPIYIYIHIYIYVNVFIYIYRKMSPIFPIYQELCSSIFKPEHQNMFCAKID